MCRSLLSTCAPPANDSKTPRIFFDSPRDSVEQLREQAPTDLQAVQVAKVRKKRVWGGGRTVMKEKRRKK